MWGRLAHRLEDVDWLGRIFDTRGSLVRMVLLDLTGVGYLLLIAESGRASTAMQWALALVAFAAALLWHKRRIVNFVGQAALLVLALVVLDDPTIHEVGAGWALLELTAWGPPVPRWWATGVLTATYLAGGITDPISKLPARVFGLVVAVGMPLLLGTVIRINSALAWQSAVFAREEHRRRESEARAARADERSAIARELHDVVAHQVASMVLRVGVARHVLPDLEPMVREVFDDVHDTGTTALDDLRRLVVVLRRPEDVRSDPALIAIEPGALPAALDGAVEKARRAGLIVDADISRKVGSLDAVRGLAVLRLTQEALTNAAKHAGVAARVRLVVAVTDGDVTWEVSDDGGGAPGVHPVLSPGGGHGLTGMRERVSVLGGDLEAGPAGDGWRVRTTLPRMAS